MQPFGGIEWVMHSAPERTDKHRGGFHRSERARRHAQRSIEPLYNSLGRGSEEFEQTKSLGLKFCGGKAKDTLNCVKSRDDLIRGIFPGGRYDPTPLKVVMEKLVMKVAARSIIKLDRREVTARRLVKNNEVANFFGQRSDFMPNLGGNASPRSAQDMAAKR